MCVLPIKVPIRKSLETYLIVLVFEIEQLDYITVCKQLNDIKLIVNDIEQYLKPLN